MFKGQLLRLPLPLMMAAFVFGGAVVVMFDSAAMVAAFVRAGCLGVGAAAADLLAAGGCAQRF
jgi:hypothetical protein